MLNFIQILILHTPSSDPTNIELDEHPYGSTFITILLPEVISHRRKPHLLDPSPLSIHQHGNPHYQDQTILLPEIISHRRKPNSNPLHYRSTKMAAPTTTTTPFFSLITTILLPESISLRRTPHLL